MRNRIVNKVKRICKSFVFRNLKNKTILVYTLGKVGSSTVYSQLKRYSIWNNVFHVHFLSDNWLKIKLKETNHFKANNAAANKVFSYIDQSPNNVTHIITLVREPVSRELSNFMQNPNDFVDNDILSYTTKDLKKAYLNKLDYDYTLQWFDTEFKSYTGFDVYAQPFDKEKGYSIYEHNATKILVMKLETLDACFEEAMKTFLGTNIKLNVVANQSENKSISSIYKALKEEIKFPENDLKALYANTYVTHFYTESEITSFIDKHRAIR
ncbi:putative capsular polysaccharide synthesis family protein [Corallibacter sp.]|uniref:putative capsular polysaccharide synthesis family protein n=1 Tax=Corallibacter sp. TaxID=2038084 RepID=UPI003AB7E290